ncbi:hypothetical protein LO772_16350 [Yinghuangia sp. ASG 101]|uniref:hypothetical protein n=1 Tax=Yinghuangia sp. ASG 101 TaxID=2896848 RepID=UPI001E3EB867|nr:hypothetical protein [Yinghuangia sp. ASG 101]UGQ14998.1 hypothetical protein LO772_16350 [Yinghuangia sp. ASG 101]
MLLVVLVTFIAVFAWTPSASAVPVPAETFGPSEPLPTKVAEWCNRDDRENPQTAQDCMNRARSSPRVLIIACSDLAGLATTYWETEAATGCYTPLLVPGWGEGPINCSALSHPQKNAGCLWLANDLSKAFCTLRVGTKWMVDAEQPGGCSGVPAGFVFVPDPQPPAAAPQAPAPQTPAPNPAPTSPPPSPAPAPTDEKSEEEKALEKKIDEVCGPIMGPKGPCESAVRDGFPGEDTLKFAKDPLGSIAKSAFVSSVWLIGNVSVAINTKPDLSVQGFVDQYAITFAAAMFLTLFFWLAAVIKRVVRGAPFFTAIGEAVGYLWLAIFASAFTPAVLYQLVGLIDGGQGIVQALLFKPEEALDAFQVSFLNGADAPGAGPIMLIVFSVLAIIAALLLWVELLIRSAMLFVGAVLAPVVYSGLVDRALWPQVRRWVGVMGAILLSKPIMVIILGLAYRVGATNTGDPVTSAISSITIMYLAVFASVMVYRFLPGFGDDLAALYYARRQGSYQARQTFGGLGGGRSPASTMRAGIGTHAERASRPTSTTTTITERRLPEGSAGVTSGIASHGSGRTGSPPPAPGPALPPPPNPPPLPPPRRVPPSRRIPPPPQSARRPSDPDSGSP